MCVRRIVWQIDNRRSSVGTTRLAPSSVAVENGQDVGLIRIRKYGEGNRGESAGSQAGIWRRSIVLLVTDNDVTSLTLAAHCERCMNS